MHTSTAGPGNHFLGKLPYAAYRRVLQVSAAHVYLTYPFVLSWSMLEAMASGCLLIGSDTAPVREVLRHGENGWLVDFFDNAALAERIVATLDDPAAQRPLRRQARVDMVAGYSLREGMQAYERFLGLLSATPDNEEASAWPVPRQPKPTMNHRQPLWRQIA